MINVDLMIKSVIIANELDNIGMYKEADVVDKMLVKTAQIEELVGMAAPYITQGAEAAAGAGEGTVAALANALKGGGSSVVGGVEGFLHTLEGKPGMTKGAIDVIRGAIQRSGLLDLAKGAFSAYAMPGIYDYIFNLGSAIPGVGSYFDYRKAEEEYARQHHTLSDLPGMGQANLEAMYHNFADPNGVINNIVPALAKIKEQAINYPGYAFHAPPPQTHLVYDPISGQYNTVTSAAPNTNIIGGSGSGGNVGSEPWTPTVIA